MNDATFHVHFKRGRCPLTLHIIKYSVQCRSIYYVDLRSTCASTYLRIVMYMIVDRVHVLRLVLVHDLPVRERLRVRLRVYAQS